MSGQDTVLWILWFFGKSHHMANRPLQYCDNGFEFLVVPVSEHAVCRYRLVCHDLHGREGNGSDIADNDLNNSDSGYMDYFEAVHMYQDEFAPAHDLEFGRVCFDRTDCRLYSFHLYKLICM